jgi:hypothetical protein
MTVGRPAASTRDDIVRMGCFKCGGPHFHRNKKTGAVCTANKPVSDSNSKLVKPVNFVAKAFSNLQHAAPGSFASVVGGSAPSQVSRAEFEQLNSKIDHLLKLQEATRAFLMANHVSHCKSDKPCLCLSKFQLGAAPKSSQSPKSSPASTPVSFNDASAQPAAVVALPKTQDKIPAPASKPDDSKIPAAPESKLDKLNSKIQIQPAFIDSVPDVLDAKRAPLVAKRRSPAELNKLCHDFNKLISSDPRFATSKSSSSSTPSPIAPEPFIHPILDQDKAVFSVGVKRDGEQILSSRAAKRQQQAGNRKARATASDFFGVQAQS